ncbi:MAG: hypothetical protein ABW068_08900, partial [Candidatus Thiodiazotropha sp.]
MNGSFYAEVFQKSLERVLRKEGFLDDFYGHFIRCQPGKAKRRLVVPGSREAILETRRAVGA